MDKLKKHHPFGFTLNNDDAVVLNSTFDAHRHSKIAETTLVSFSIQIPSSFRNSIMETLTHMGAPVFGEQYAVTSSTIQSDSDYLFQSNLAGYPLTRFVYKSVGGRRIVDCYHGTSGLDSSLMGPLSRYKLLIDVDDATWKKITRFDPLEKYLNSHKIPYRTSGNKIYVNNVKVNVSGHILNYLIAIAMLKSPASRAYNFGGYRCAYITNVVEGNSSAEPSYSSTAWHSWLENEVAVLSALSMIRRFYRTMPIDKGAFRLALLAAVELLRHNKRSARTSVSVIRDGLRLYDSRMWTAKADIKHWFVVMPMGTGKSTLHKRLPHVTRDIDDAMTIAPGLTHTANFLRDDAVATGDWSRYNSWYYKWCMIYIENEARSPTIFLIHHADLVRTLFPHAPVLVILLPEQTILDRVAARDGLGSLRLAKQNWNDVKNYDPDWEYKTDSTKSRLTNYRVLELDADARIDDSLFEWFNGK